MDAARIFLKRSTPVYTTGPTMAMIALKCPDIEVVVVDINQQRIDAWNSDHLPIYEPGLDEVVQEARGRNLFFSTDVDKHVAEADIVFVRYKRTTSTPPQHPVSTASTPQPRPAAWVQARQPTSPTGRAPHA